MILVYDFVIMPMPNCTVHRLVGMVICSIEFECDERESRHALRGAESMDWYPSEP